MAADFFGSFIGALADDPALAGGGSDDCAEHTQQRRFAGAVGAQQTEYFSGGYGKGRSAHGLDGFSVRQLEDFAEVLRVNHDARLSFGVWQSQTGPRAGRCVAAAASLGYGAYA